MDCTICGLPIIIDMINEEECAWCPRCGKDFTYEYCEAVINAESTEPKGESSRYALSRNRRVKV